MTSYIEQFKDGNCYRIDGLEYYESEIVDMFQCSVFKFCGCGRPEENISYIRDGLEHIAALMRHWEDKDFVGGGHDWYEQWDKAAMSIFGNAVSRDFFYYWASETKPPLLEHGGSIPGWLTEDGKAILEDLKRLPSTRGDQCQD